MCCFMEVFEVKGIIPNLVHPVSSEFLFTNFEFKNKNCWANQQQDVNASPHARDRVFEINLPFITAKNWSQQIDLVLPCLLLSLEN